MQSFWCVRIPAEIIREKHEIEILSRESLITVKVGRQNQFVSLQESIVKRWLQLPVDNFISNKTSRIQRDMQIFFYIMLDVSYV